jgi:hypothetical protein
MADLDSTSTTSDIAVRIRSDLKGISTWKDADEAIAIISAAEMEISVIEAEINAQLAALKALQQTKILRLTAMLREFVTQHREDMGDKKKSRKLAHGEVGFKLGNRRVVYNESEEFTILMLKKHKIENCIVTTESVDKMALHKLEEADLVKIDVAIEQEERFFYKSSEAKAAKYPKTEAELAPTPAK